TRKRGAQRAREPRPEAARRGQTHAAEHARRRKGNQPVPALPRAGSGRVGEQISRREDRRPGARVRCHPGLEEQVLNNKIKVHSLLLLLAAGCATQAPVPPPIIATQDALPAVMTQQPAPKPPEAAIDASRLPAFEGERQVVKEP